MPENKAEDQVKQGCTMMGAGCGLIIAGFGVIIALLLLVTAGGLLAELFK